MTRQIVAPDFFRRSAWHNRIRSETHDGMMLDRFTHRATRRHFLTISAAGIAALATATRGGWADDKPLADDDGQVFQARVMLTADQRNGQRGPGSVSASVFVPRGA